MTRRARWIGFALGATVLVGIGLAAAIAQVQAAARRAQCESNLKQLGLALHNYQSVYDCFPPGAAIAPELPFAKRQGFYTLIMTYAFCWHCWGLSERLSTDVSAAWDAPTHRRIGTIPLEMLHCPDSGFRPSHGVYSGFHNIDLSRCTELVPADYVGMAGVGADAASLLTKHPRAGIFGYERLVRPEDVTDGLSSTMMLVETSRLVAPWTAAGPATLRAVDPKVRPYVGKGRPFGGNHPDGAAVLFADGSVRFVRSTVDPKVFEGMATIAGGEDVSTVAP